MGKFKQQEVLTLLKTEYNDESLNAFVQLRYALRNDAIGTNRYPINLPISKLLQRTEDLINEKGFVNVVFTGLPGCGKSVLLSHYIAHLGKKGQECEHLNHEDVLKQVAEKNFQDVTEISPGSESWQDYDRTLEQRLKSPLRTSVRAIEIPLNRGLKVLEELESKVVIELVGTRKRQKKAQLEREAVHKAARGDVLASLARLNIHFSHLDELGVPSTQIEELIKERYASMANETHIKEANENLRIQVRSLPKNTKQPELVRGLNKDSHTINQIKYYEEYLGGSFARRDTFIVYTPDMTDIYLDARNFLV